MDGDVEVVLGVCFELELDLDELDVGVGCVVGVGGCCGLEGYLDVGWGLVVVGYGE